MIKRIIGALLAIASLAVIVLAVLHRDDYRPMVDWPWEEPSTHQDAILYGN